MNLEWDDDNIEHIGQHDVEPDEVDGALQGRVLRLRGREDRYLLLAQTEEGRYLTIIAVLKVKACGA